MRISVPTIPQAVLTNTSATKPITPAAAIERIAAFLGPGNVSVITGAGVSVDSGIRAYRGEKGRYLNPNYKPIFYHELMDETPRGFAFRQRYWLRSYLGYQPVRDALPNTTHYALAALQYKSVIPKLITQNVDGLHHKALRNVWNEDTLRERILELHGSLHKVHCKHGHIVDRNTFQDWLSAANPQWKEYSDNLEATGQKPRTNPDGDVPVELEGVSYDDFVVPECPTCLQEGRRNSVQKPELIFFGESIRPEVRERSFHDVETCDRLFLIGTTLATFSAYRLLKHALELRKPVLMLNVGPTRADGLPGLEKIEIPSGTILRDVVRAVLGSDASYDPVVRDMLSSGVVKPPQDD
ncbi:DHS-like NAD/FAD-binding domain-containing protein [Panus rudis PR-1116 ss-1]|nr:DHS-like NAD/FAD-binding domain-containing protein [Panus rudis PR-1116 ss-1]